MIKFDVTNRFTGKVQFSAQIDCAADAPTSIKLGLAVKWAIASGANLSRADLSGANLSGANLSRADLSGANLSGTDLSRANLSGTDLSRAYLSGADLSRAYLSGAYLSGADLSGAYLSRADLSGTDLSGADLSGANLSGAKKIDDANIPVIPKIDAVILVEIERGGTLDMGSWHGPEGWCGTTHCRAGWAVHCAGKPGKALEDLIGTHLAAAMIYRKSRPGKPAPWFFAPADIALADIRQCAAEQAAS